jgi:ribonuclease HI
MTWMRPPPGWFKINCDATVDGKKGVMGGGLIIRDSAREPFAARSFTKRRCLDLTTAEAIGVVQAARFCKETGVNNKIVEGDASTIITALRETEPNVSRYGHLIEEARMILIKFPTKLATQSCKTIFEWGNQLPSKTGY